jgi:electron transfer flavoprotein alpha/beta subunit
MQPYQQRVVEEAEQLDERIDKLFAFTAGPQFRQVPEDERNRMLRQLRAMGAYSAVLHERIEAFT